MSAPAVRRAPEGGQPTSLRVLQLTDMYRPLIGGIERHVESLARELVARGHRVSVATMYNGDAPRFEVEDGVRVHRLAAWSRRLGVYRDVRRPFHPPFPDPGVATALRRVIAEERPDVIHAHSWMIHSLLPQRRRAGPKVVLSLHDFSSVCPKTTYVHRGELCAGPAYAKCVRCAREQYGAGKSFAVTTGLRLTSGLTRRIDRCIAVSSAVAAPAVEHAGGCPVEVIPVFYADAPAVDPLPRPPFLPRGEPLIFVGVLSRHKGVDVLTKAYAALRDAPPLVMLGPERRDTPRSFPAGVVVVRDVPHEQVMAAWACCSIAIVPSVWPEPFGTVAIEAMAAGRPVVASAVGGLREIVVQGETGVLVPPGDPAALAAALRELIADPARRARMGQAARRRARENYSAAAVVPRIEAVYRDVLRPGHQPLRRSERRA
jgi:glycosyltransferase involved in cell wall biosynthesis